MAVPHPLIGPAHWVLSPEFRTLATQQRCKNHFCFSQQYNDDNFFFKKGNKLGEGHNVLNLFACCGACETIVLKMIMIII